MTAHFTETTTGYWQRLIPAGEAPQAGAPWRHGYPARLPDSRVLMLPIRQLASEPAHAVASLIVNQASLEVVDTLAAMLADRLSAFAAEHVIGLPTLGLALAPGVTRALGHARYVPLGYSRKFWYEEALSVPVVSITTPVPGKRVYLDPNLRPLVEGRRLVLVDDAISSGSTLDAAWDLIESVGGEVAACGVAMIQGRRWVEKLGAARAGRVVGVFESPLLKAVPQGWVPRD
jgi:adenine/guanine phosphoribosyltransferase-like PRPP-binding protein